MAHEIEVQWMGKMQFNALVNGHTIVMDGPEKVGGEDNGPIPKPFTNGFGWMYRNGYRGYFKKSKQKSGWF